MTSFAIECEGSDLRLGDGGLPVDDPYAYYIPGFAPRCQDFICSGKQKFTYGELKGKTFSDIYNEYYDDLPIKVLGSYCFGRSSLQRQRHGASKGKCFGCQVQTKDFARC